MTDTTYAVASQTPVLQGEAVVLDVDGTEVVLVDIEGTLHAFDDTCTHRSCPLSDGTFDGHVVACPCHQSRFDIRTGQVLNGPATLPIRVRRVIVDGGRVLIER